MIIKTNKELRDHLGGAVSTSLSAVTDDELENNRILAYVPVAERKYIRKAIGNEMHALLDGEYNSESGVSGENKELFDLLQKACAFYTYAEYSAFSTGSDGDSGYQVDEKTNPKMWQVLERMWKSYDLAAGILEEALKLLFEGDFSAFKNSTVWQNTYGLLVNSGEVLHRALPASGGSYRIFLTLWPYLNDVETRECRMIMGEATYSLIKGKRNGSGEILTPAEKETLSLAEKVSAHAAYLEALPEVFTVETEGGALRVKSEFDGIRNRNTPNDKQMYELQKSIEKKVNRYKGELKAYLDAHLEDFPQYKAERYRGGGRLGFLDNKNLNTIFSVR